MSEKKEQPDNVRLITLDPGHFHAALIQKSMYPSVDSTVYVYAPDGPDVKGHLNRIDAYNHRPEAPTHWNEKVYLGTDFVEKMLSDKAGNVVVISGNNQKKTEYIQSAIAAGFHVLADKPMAINKANFENIEMAIADDGIVSKFEETIRPFDKKIYTNSLEIKTLTRIRDSLLPKLMSGKIRVSE